MRFFHLFRQKGGAKNLPQGKQKITRFIIGNGLDYFKFWFIGLFENAKHAVLAVQIDRSRAVVYHTVGK